MSGRVAQAALVKTIAKVNGVKLDDAKSERPRSEVKHASKSMI